MYFLFLRLKLNKENNITLFFIYFGDIFSLFIKSYSKRTTKKSCSKTLSKLLQHVKHCNGILKKL